ncbi:MULTISPECIES: hypothetical protein [Pseudomonas]|uniref:hypothetical protein n=1 Tax=Pseudomonas TaxID=286 RepID=UPI0027416DE7|nr:MULTISPECIES: hypothetical protein [Pseudomonas]
MPGQLMQWSSDQHAAQEHERQPNHRDREDLDEHFLREVAKRRQRLCTGLLHDHGPMGVSDCGETGQNRNALILGL